MTNRDDDIPAFPVPTISGPDLEVSYPPHVRGMTLRDWFAGQALAGLIASNDDDAGDRIEKIPPYAYQIADAMLAAREAR